MDRFQVGICGVTLSSTFSPFSGVKTMDAGRFLASLSFEEIGAYQRDIYFIVQENS